MQWVVSRLNARGRSFPARALAVMMLLTGVAVCRSIRAEFVEDWGRNDNGEIGNGTTTTTPPYGVGAPVAVTSLSNGVTSIAAGAAHGLAIQNGGVYAWGANGNGELGNGTTTDSSTPVAVNNLSSGVTAIAGGQGFSLAIQNGGAYSWGWGVNGQLGDGSYSSGTETPVPIVGLSSGVTAIAAGGYHGLAIQNGSAYAWGYNGNGGLGDGTTMGSSTPVAVSNLTSGVTAMAGGGAHSLAIQNGGAYAWGWNAYGQLGNGTTTDEDSPVAIGGLSSGVTAIAAGYCHSLAVMNGGVYSWGYNSYGQLGNGTTTDSSTPIHIDPADLTNIVSVAAGYDSSFALSSDGSLWVWGDDYNGELGLGTTESDYLTPQHLLPPTGYVFTSIDANSFGNYAIATLTTVPEPDSLALLALTGVAILARRRG